MTWIQFHDTIAIWRTKIIFARWPRSRPRIRTPRQAHAQCPRRIRGHRTAGAAASPRTEYFAQSAIPYGRGGAFRRPERGWQECGADLAMFLKAGARALRNQPVPDISAYGERIRTLQRVLRFDSIAMAWHDPARAAFSMIALAVDRAGNAVAGRIPPEAPRPTSRSPTATRPLTTSSASCGTCCSRSTSGHRPSLVLCLSHAGPARQRARSPGGLWIAALPPPGRHGTGRRSTESRAAAAAGRRSSALVVAR